MASLLALHATVAGAQARRPRTPPRRLGDLTVDLNVGAQLTGDVTQQFSITKNAEAAPIAIRQPFSAGLFVDGGVTVRVRRRLGLAIGVSVLSHDGGDATVSASVPHPVFFNRPRDVSGTAPLSQSQTAIHVDAAYLAPPRGRLWVTLLGGVSIIHIQQTLVTDINVADPFPFDAPTFSSAVTTNASATPIGFNVGVDVTWRRWRRVGLGALARYSRASATLTPGAAGATDVVAGGLQAGAGVRFSF